MTRDRSFKRLSAPQLQGFINQPSREDPWSVWVLADLHGDNTYQGDGEGKDEEGEEEDKGGEREEGEDGEKTTEGETRESHGQNS